MLVVHVQRRRHPFGQHPCPEPSRGPLGDAPREDQLHLIGAADVEILADHLLEKDPARERPVQNLGQGELRLEDRRVVTAAGRATLGGERMGQSSQPLAQQLVDLGRWIPVTPNLRTVARISSETGTRKGVKQHTEAESSSMLTESSQLLTEKPAFATDLPNAYSTHDENLHGDGGYGSLDGIGLAPPADSDQGSRPGNGLGFFGLIELGDGHAGVRPL